MNKLEMAHQMACAMMASNNGYTIGGAIECAWEYADAMQKEWDERNHVSSSDEWQPDWSQAPDGFDWFCVGSRSRIGFFCKIEPKIVKDHYWFIGEDAKQIHNHSYEGDWRYSVKKRP